MLTTPLAVPSTAALTARLAPLVRTASGLAVLALGAVGLHVVDDAFLRPPDGTSPTDHLAAGLVPMALLALAAWGVARVRPGARAVVLLLAGAFGVVTAVEAVYDTSRGELRGDDWTGLVAAPAGLALLGLAVATLWTSRRHDALRRRYPRRAGLAVAGLAVVVGVVYPLAFAHGITHVGRDAVAGADLGPGAQRVTFESSDGLELTGLYLPSRNGAAVIAFPGPGALDHARMLARHGYGVLMFDQRGEGDSEGQPNALGWEGEHDVRGAVDFLRRQPGVDPQRIGGLGLSVGGEVLLTAAAHDAGLQAVVSDGAGIRSLREQRLAGGLFADVIWAGLTAGTAIFADSAPPPSLADLTAQIEDVPLLLIHSGHGGGGEELTADYAAAARTPTTLWEIPEAGHTEGLTARPAEYERRVMGFLDAALLRPAS
jgi:hypothetical protein